jgi:hypothetical protein
MADIMDDPRGGCRDEDPRVADDLLHHDERGTGPCVVLVHAGFLDRRMWANEVDALRDLVDALRQAFAARDRERIVSTLTRIWLEGRREPDAVDPRARCGARVLGSRVRRRASTPALAGHPGGESGGPRAAGARGGTDHHRRRGAPDQPRSAGRFAELVRTFIRSV